MPAPALLLPGTMPSTLAPSTILRRSAMDRQHAAARSRLRIATISVLLLVFAALAFGQWVSARRFYGNSFDDAERRDALARARHAEAIFADLKDLLERNAADNAAWDESYRYMLGQNPQHARRAFDKVTYKLLRISGLAFVRSDGTPVFLQRFDPDRDQFFPGGDALRAALGPGGALSRNLLAQGRSGGYVRIGTEIFAWGAGPIMHTDGTGPPVGSLVMLSVLDHHLLEAASGVLDSQVTLEVAPRAGLPPLAQTSVLQFPDVEYSVPSDAQLETRVPLTMLDETNALIVKLTTPRVVHETALRASRYLFWTTLVFGTVLGAVALRFIEWRLVRPLQAANARNAAMLDAIPDRLLRLGRSGRIVDARIGAPAPAAGEAGTPVAPFAPDVAARIEEATRSARASGTVQTLDFSAPGANAQQLFYEARIAVLDDDEALCLVRDITDRKRAEERIHGLAYYDSLTKLPNRQSFLEHLGREVARSARRAGRLAVLFIDLDGFKGVNDTLGHHAGDLLLQWSADRLKATLRPEDMISRGGETGSDQGLARLGGDEFVALIRDFAEVEDALIVARRLRDVMRRPFTLEGREIVLTTSIGIALYPEDGLEASTLLKHADSAMYHAKSSGRDCAQLYSASLTRNAIERLDRVTDLRHALERGEFSLAFQPQIDLASDRIDSVEALIRWNQPNVGLVSPAEFIPLAEEVGLIVPIGAWVLEAACTAAAGWRSAGRPLRVAVNLSPSQFKDPHLLERVQETLAQTGLPPSLLELEITEGAIMEDSAATMATMKTLRDIGIRIALDDFGTGYSSMSYLKRMPLDTLKIDRSFISGLPRDRESQAIVRAILSLAKSLGFRVTAEGVETVEQVDMLREMACDNLQGFHFSRPVPPGEILPMIDRFDERRALSAT
jgi:diguanylate cyclase (GGDEF)-like protein